jgi:hypothetical protein
MGLTVLSYTMTLKQNLSRWINDDLAGAKDEVALADGLGEEGGCRRGVCRSLEFGSQIGIVS